MRWHRRFCSLFQGCISDHATGFAFWEKVSVGGKSLGVYNFADIVLGTLIFRHRTA